MDKKKLKKIILIIFIVVLIIAGIAFYINSTHYQSTDDAYIESDLIQIAPRVSGQIEEIYIKDNQRIKEGDLIAKIDDSDYKVKYEQAQANYEKALYSQKVAKARLDAINSEIKSAEKDLKRYKNLYQAGAVSQQVLDSAQTKYDNTKAKLLAAEEDILSSSNNKVADANLKALKALRDQAELYLKYTEIVAPNDGTVTNKNVDKGKYVQVGQPLFTLVSDNIWVEANYKENQVGAMKPGQPVEIKIDAYPKKKFKGKIDSIQRASGAKSSLFPPENAVGSFVKIVQRIPVKIIFTEDIDTDEYNIVAGMSVEPRVKIK
ncbi:HlyD family secretion protein [bacterium]|nr:HlyD family secretion protein [bacterium]